MSMSFTQNEMFLAMVELEKVWDYEEHKYNQCLFNGKYVLQEVLKMDQEQISYGINLGVLRQLFAEDDLKEIS